MRILIESLLDSRLIELGRYLEEQLNNVPIEMDEDAHYESANLTFTVEDETTNATGQDTLYCRLTLDYPNGNKHVEHMFISLEPRALKNIFRITSNDDFSPYSFGKGFNSKEEVLDFIKEVEHVI